MLLIIWFVIYICFILFQRFSLALSIKSTTHWPGWSFIHVFSLLLLVPSQEQCFQMIAFLFSLPDYMYIFLRALIVWRACWWWWWWCRPSASCLLVFSEDYSQVDAFLRFFWDVCVCVCVCVCVYFWYVCGERWAPLPLWLSPIMSVF